ncbi:MAG: methylmalonyl-CoA mutase, partial [Anaerolineae bacterium]|nr:methylmalonyl-CoA mutase [Anaerolineae bacterium]
MTNHNDVDQTATEAQRWTDTTLKKTLDRFPERRDQFVTVSSASVERLYTPADLADNDYLRDISFPGEYPYTRGV